MGLQLLHARCMNWLGFGHGCARYHSSLRYQLWRRWDFCEAEDFLTNVAARFAYIKSYLHISDTGSEIMYHVSLSGSLRRFSLHHSHVDCATAAPVDSRCVDIHSVVTPANNPPPSLLCNMSLPQHALSAYCAKEESTAAGRSHQGTVIS